MLKLYNMKGLIYTLICTASAMIGYTIHGSIFYAIINFIFAPISIVYWLISHQLTFEVIKETFKFFN